MAIREKVVDVDVIMNDLIMGQLLTLTKRGSTSGEPKHWLMDYIETRCHLTRINQWKHTFCYISRYETTTDHIKTCFQFCFG
jgi:hypothetical protein